MDPNTHFMQNEKAAAEAAYQDRVHTRIANDAAVARRVEVAQKMAREIGSTPEVILSAPKGTKLIATEGGSRYALWREGQVGPAGMDVRQGIDLAQRFSEWEQRQQLAEDEHLLKTGRHPRLPDALPAWVLKREREAAQTRMALFDQALVTDAPKIASAKLTEMGATPEVIADVETRLATVGPDALRDFLVTSKVVDSPRGPVRLVMVAPWHPENNPLLSDAAQNAASIRQTTLDRAFTGWMAIERSSRLTGPMAGAVRERMTGS